jgi:hypothetical protein
MSLPDLAAVLWRQREQLELLVYRLECEQLLLAAGRTRFLPLATAEVETLIEELQIVELQRAAVADAVAGELQLPAWRSWRPPRSHRGPASWSTTATPC